MDELYIDVSTNLLYDIRLRIEGAVDLYEGDALCLKRLAVDNDKLDAACAFDTIGSALYDLRRDIQKLHAAHIATEGGVEMVIANGRDPAILYDIVEGKPVGTRLKAKEAAR